MSKKEAYQVLLYYQYVDIDDPETFAAEHLEFCKELELKGRIIVAHEGINGTVSGTVEQTEKYMQTMNNDTRFADMVFKVDEHDGQASKRLSVRARKKLVTLRLEDDIKSKELTSKYLSPQEFYEAM